MGKEVQTEGEITDIKRGDNGKFVVVLKEIDKWDNFFFNCELSNESLSLASNLSNGSKIVIRGTVYQFHQLEQGIFIVGNIVSLRNSVITHIMTQAEIDFRQVLEEARRGERNAQFNVACRYAEGNGTAQNYDEAVRWYKEAINKGHVTAMEHLGSMYRDGRGVEKNLDEAIRLFRKSADNGSSAGMTLLGHMYENGIGTDKNITEALVWYNKGACRGNEFALSKIKTYAEEGNSDAVRYLADMYYSGNGLKKDYSEDFKLYSRISGQDESGYAEYMLARMYEDGQGTDKNIDEAVRFYQSSAEHGYAESAYMLSKIYGEKDALQTVRYLKQAMNLGHEEAKSAYNNLRREFEKMLLQNSDELKKFVREEKKDVIDTFNALIAELGLSYDLGADLQSDSSRKYVINGNKVNIRAQPNTRAKVTIQLNTGDIVEVLDTSGRGSNIWYKIKTSKGNTGWVFGEYIRQK